MSQSDSIHVTVSVDDAHFGKIEEVAQRLRSAGMNVGRTLGAIGAISGHVDSGHLAGLSKVPGVSAVEREHSYQLPPPDAKVQ
jgi:riboflavin synthase alpha subunit